MNSPPFFRRYIFADYSGAVNRNAQRRAIRVAIAEQDKPPVVLPRGFTREDLIDELLGQLEAATQAGARVCFGQDHQYGIPIGLAREIGFAGCTWREALKSLCDGTYGGPALAHASTFGANFNNWLLQREGGRPFFYSATKHEKYGVPRTNPRNRDNSVYRLTERCGGAPKALNRVGDNGSVGGQTLVGLIAIHELLDRAAKAKIPVRCWPFDGLDITSSAYHDSHVLVEPYPSAVRGHGVPQNDIEDARASAMWVQTKDCGGCLAHALDLSGLSKDHKQIVSFEGWIVSHRPENLL
jgi:hypothetical protein